MGLGWLVIVQIRILVPKDYFLSADSFARLVDTTTLKLCGDERKEYCAVSVLIFMITLEIHDVKTIQTVVLNFQFWNVVE